MAHKWPENDLFRNGIPYGNFPDAWLRTAVFGAAAEVVTTYGLEGTAGQLHSGQFGNSGNLLDSARVGSIFDQAFPVTDQKLAGFLFRNLQSSADTRVTLGFRVQQLLGSKNFTPDDAFQCAVVIARAQGTPTITSPNSPLLFRADYPDFYFFMLVNDVNPKGFDFIIGKSVAGVPQVLAQLPATVPNTAEALDIRRATQLRLTVVNNGPNVDLVASWTPQSVVRIVGFGFQSGQNTVVPGEERVVVIHTDTSPGVLTGGGRFGFGATPPQADSGPTTWAVETLIDFFEVYNTASSTLLLREEWDRAETRFTTEVATSTGFNGQNLMQGWAGDRFGDDATDRLEKNMQSVGTDEIEIDEGSAFYDGGGLMLSQRRASGPNQKRSLTTSFPGGPLFPTETGIWLRYGKGQANPNTQAALTDLDLDATGHRGYLFLTQATGATTYNLELWRFIETGRVLMSRVLNLPVSVGSNKWELEVGNFQGVDDFQGSVKLIATVAGVQVIWTEIFQPFIAGNAASSEILDGTTERVLTGNGQGIWAAGLPVASGTPITLVEWREETLTITNEIIPPNEQPAVVLHSEIFEAFGTLTVPLSWPVDLKEDGYLAHQWYTESLHLLHASRELLSGRVWTVRAVATETDRDDAIAFWEAHAGPVKAFDWVEPLRQQTVKVLLVLPKIETAQTGQSVFTYKFDLVEVR